MSEEKLLSGHTQEPVTQEELNEMKEVGLAGTDPMVRLQPDGWLLNANKYFNKIYSFKVSTGG